MGSAALDVMSSYCDRGKRALKQESVRFSLEVNPHEIAGWLLASHILALFCLFPFLPKEGYRSSGLMTCKFSPSVSIILTFSSTHLSIHPSIPFYRLDAIIKTCLWQPRLIWSQKPGPEHRPPPPRKLPSSPRSSEELRLAAKLTSRNMGISCCSDNSKIATPDPALTRSSGSGTLPPVHCWSTSGTWREENKSK